MAGTRAGGRRRPRLALLQRRDEVRRVAIVPVTGDRGLAGAFNAQVLRRAFGRARARRPRAGGHVLHRRARRAHRRSASAGSARRAVDRVQRQAGLRDAQAIAHARRAVRDGGGRPRGPRLQRVRLAARPAGDRERPAADPDEACSTGRGVRREGGRRPEPRLLLRARAARRSSQRLLPVYVETELYRALLESAASEQGAG